MSHKATNWAVSQRGIPPAAKVVLWHLADRHHPDQGCFPSQDLLAADCEISRRGLNNQLEILEKAGLIRRVQRTDSRTKRQKSTRYILGFEGDFKPHIESRVQNLHMGAVCKNEQEPCAKSGKSRVQNLHTNPVREPVREPVRKIKKENPRFDEFWDQCPRKIGKGAARSAFSKACETNNPQVLIDAMVAYATSRIGEDEQFTPHPATWLNQERWADEVPKVTRIPTNGGHNGQPSTHQTNSTAALEQIARLAGVQ